MLETGCTTRVLSPADFPQWDEFVSTSPQGTIFQRSDFLTMLGETDPSLELIALGCFDAHGDLCAGLALFCKRYWGIPLTPGFHFFYNGPLVAPVEAYNQAYHGEIQHQRISSLLQMLNARFPTAAMSTHPALLDMRPFIFNNWSLSLHYTHVWNLENLATLQKDMSQGERKKIRHGEKTLRLETQPIEAIWEPFIPIFKETMTRYHWQPSEGWLRSFFRRIQWMQQSGLCRIYSAWTKQNELIGALIVILSPVDHTAYFWRLAYDQRLARQGISPYLNWMAASDLAPNFQFANIDEGTSLGLSRYKDHIGTQIRPYYEVTPNSTYNRVIGLLRKVTRRTWT